MVLAGWLAQCESTIIYERRLQSQVLYVIPITSILGRLALVPVGETGNGADENQWWYVNSFSLKWATSQ